MQSYSSARRTSQERTVGNSERLRKWRENSILEAIREKGYEPDEIVVRGEHD